MNNSLNVLMTRKLKKAKKEQKIKSKIDYNSITIEKIIEILNKNQDKSYEDISILKYFCLNKTKLIQKFVNDNIDESSYDLILSLSLPSTTYKNIETKNSVIVNIGEPGDYLYIILRGKAAVYEIQKFNKDITGYEYYLLLQNYKKNNENYLLEKTISENKLYFPIDLEDINIIDKIILKTFLNKQEKKLVPNYLDLLIEKAGLKYSDFKLESYIQIIEKRNKSMLEGMDLDGLSSDEKVYEYQKMMIYNIQEAWNVAYRNEKKILEDLNYIDIDIIKKYIFLSDTKNLETITYYKTTFNKTVEDMDYFGEIEHKIYTNKVISLTDNLELFCFKTELYIEFVRRIKSKLLGNKINFLLDNFFFHSIFKGYFEKYYFKYFKIEQYKMKQIIVKENDPILYCYFIKSGSVKLSSNRSIIENHILIEIIKNIIEKNNENKQEIKTNTDLNEIYSGMKNNLEYLSNELNIKNNMHLMTLQANNGLGNEFYYYGLNFLYTAQANSEIVEVYKISTDKLMKILNDKNHKAFYHYRKYCEENIKILFDRLLKLNNMLLINIKKVKNRHFENIFNPQNLEQKISTNKNYKKLNNIVDKFNSIDTIRLLKSKSLYNFNNNDNDIKSSSFGKDELNNNINIKKENDTNFFLTTQKSKRTIIKRLNNNFHINLRKKNDSVKLHRINENILNNNFKEKNTEKIHKNKSFCLIPLIEKDGKKDLTSYIKIFDYKENIQKQENRELLRANLALIRLENAERNEIKKLRKENKTCQNFFKMSSGENRSFVVPLNYIPNYNKDIHKKKEENESKRIFTNNIIDLFKRNLFNNKKMLVTSIYKNKLSDFFDNSLGIPDFKYDLKKTLLMNKKKYEYSIFDKKYTFKKVKSKSLPKRFKKFSNISEINLIN